MAAKGLLLLEDNMGVVFILRSFVTRSLEMESDLLPAQPSAASEGEVVMVEEQSLENVAFQEEVDLLGEPEGEELLRILPAASLPR